MMVNRVEVNGNLFGSAMAYRSVAPGNTTMEETVLASRKRSRVVTSPTLPPIRGVVQNQIGNIRSGSLTFLGEDMTFQIQQQQSEIDRFVAQHTEKVKRDIELRRKKFSERIAAAIKEIATKKMKAKEEEIQKIEKLNRNLDERVKALTIEKQIWRDLAHKNEATANALRFNLEQIITQQHRTIEAAFVDDAQSCCDSNDEEINGRALRDSSKNNDRCIEPPAQKRGRYRICRSCEKEESCVVLLPCRHLCLCTVCGTSRHICPVCNSPKTKSVHVNFTA